MTWSDMLFLHWPVPERIVRHGVPELLSLDLFSGAAWISVASARIRGVRPMLAPPIPGFSSFLQLSVRTYVRHEGEPGVFFFSLDASNSLAVWLARTIFHLPYFHARMSMNRRGDMMKFGSRRTHQGARRGTFDCAWTPGEPVARGRSGDPSRFLFERANLFNAHDGEIFRCRIEHEPWALRTAHIESLNSTMTEAAGLPAMDAPALAHHCDKLAVEASPLRCDSLCGDEAGDFDPALLPPPATFNRLTPDGALRDWPTRTLPSGSH